MTKFILVGGYIQKAPDGGESFCKELIKGHSVPVKILDCIFARIKERWDESFLADRELFNKYIPEKFELHLADYENFIDQVKWADVVFLRGGSSEELIRALEERAKWKDHIEDKTIAGTSAGADALSTYYFGLDSLEARKGLGLVPIKVIPHFKSDYHGWEFDWNKAYSNLKSYKEDIPILALAEGQFEVMQ